MQESIQAEKKRAGFTMLPAFIHPLNVYSPKDQDRSILEFAGDTLTYPCISW